MARRRRKPPPTTPAIPTANDEPRDHMARVRVADDVWSEFRAAAGPTPLNVVLGELVQREVNQTGLAERAPARRKTTSSSQRSTAPTSCRATSAP